MNMFHVKNVKISYKYEIFVTMLGNIYAVIRFHIEYLYYFLLLFLQSQEDLWLSSAQKLTNIIKQIIEFAKMVPGFMKFAQDDQIALLKRGKW